ncbi:hypothetical protein [Brevundimonas sp.]|uniref:PIN-like domain-containing protein n=1 Tax=Brevundimonas sp. TaxID=1871086 RepID=UPI0035B3727C
MTLIRFDENISRRIPAALRQLRLPEGVEIETVFEANAVGHADVDWLADFAHRHGSCIISGDERMRDRPAERAALQAAGIVAVFPPEGRFWTPLRLYGQAAFLIRWFPIIVQLARDSEAGEHFRLPPSWTLDIASVRKLPRLDSE